MIEPEIDNMSDGKTQLIIEILNELCKNGYCENPDQLILCRKNCPLAMESIKRFGVNILVTD